MRFQLGHHEGRRRRDLAAAVEAAREHDPKVIVEAGIVGREIECGVLQGRGDDAPAHLRRDRDRRHRPAPFYDFEAKYLDDAACRCPRRPTCRRRVPERVRELAAQAFEALGCEGLARVDFFYTHGGEVVVNELNTMPGFTPYSMYPRLWERSA